MTTLRGVLGTIAAPVTNVWRLALLQRFNSKIRSRNSHRNPRMPGARPRVTMLVVSNLARDPRVERGARTLASRGYHVTVICPAWALRDEEHTVDWGPEIEIQVIHGSRIRRFPYLVDRLLFRKAVESNPWAIHCHDLNTCVVGLAAATDAGAHCVCDFHEWFSRNVAWNERHARYERPPALVRALLRSAEHRVMEKADAVITVSESIGRALESEYGSLRHVHVIRNVPFHQISSASAKIRPLREELGLSPSTFILLYQGGVGPGRNLEPVIRAMALVDDAVLVIRGPGIEAYGESYLQLARAAGAAGRVVCLPPVSSRDVVAAASSADAGVWTLEDVCDNFRLALPNKVFEYLSAGLPVLAADFPEVRKLVERFSVGLTFQPDRPDSIARAIIRLQHDGSLRGACRASAGLALASLDPAREWNSLADLYDGFS